VSDAAASAGLSRRRLLAVAGIGVGGVALGGVVGGVVGASQASGNPSPSLEIIPFRGEHQAGIATAVQDRLLFASYDITSSRRADVMALLQAWTDAAERLTRGDDVGAPASRDQSPPTDTGEAAGLHPARLTLTFGFGPTLFEKGGVDRFGLRGRRPAPLVDVPAFPRDELDPAMSGGDLCVQACGDDPQVLFHAIRNLTRIGRGTVVLRWSQEGFGRTSSTSRDQETARNLMGFKDGTANLRAGTPVLDENVWVGNGDDPAWMRGGSYLVVRRIRILIENWDRSALADQEATIGRTRASGAPLGRTGEFDAVDLSATRDDGTPLIPVDAHIAVANQDANAIHILRRGYNFTDGVDPKVGQLDAGLFFLAYQRDPRRQFIPLQQKLASSDALNEYIKHVSSAVFAIPPGLGSGGWIGQSFFT
jgi:deferrochelatase/peroxidase EfeB